MKKLLILFSILLLPSTCFAADLRITIHGWGAHKIVIGVYRIIPSGDTRETEYHTYKEIMTSEEEYSYMIKDVPSGYFVDVDVEVIDKQCDRIYALVSISMTVNGKYWFHSSGYIRDSAMFRYNP